MGEFLMPSLGADMDSGTVLEWRVKPGDTVHRGDIVAVVDTDKADIEVELFEDGVIEELLVPVGQQVPVGTPLARLGPMGATLAAPTHAEQKPFATRTRPDDAQPDASAPAKRSSKASPRQPVRNTHRRAWPSEVTPPTRVRATPFARRLAAERNVELTELTGTGPGGAVRAADLPTPGPMRAPEPAARPAAPPERASGERQQAMRRAIGDLMARSKREIPHYYVATTIDLGRMTTWLTELNAARSVTDRVLPAAMLLRASARAARELPDLNGFWDAAQQRLVRADHVNLGVAVALRGGGLIAPAIRDADQLSVDELMSAMRDLVERARGGRLRSSEMSDSTLTVTVLGDQGADEVYGVIYPPQVAVVGFGRILDRPWACEGMLGVRPTVRATLAGDHRATDGHTGSRYLAVVDRLLQDPEHL